MYFSDTISSRIKARLLLMLAAALVGQCSYLLLSALKLNKPKPLKVSSPGAPPVDLREVSSVPRELRGTKAGHIIAGLA